METQKKYNLTTAVAMVVGIVIGSGVFFKASSILNATEGNLGLSILAWIVGGLVMIVSAYTFSLIASNCKKSSNLVDMADETVGRVHSYVVSWYTSVIYYPLIVGVLGWVCANFTCVLFNIESNVLVFVLSFVYVVIMYLLNTLAPKLAGYFQVTTTTIKIIPLIVMAIVGTIYGLFFNNNTLVENFTSMPIFNNSTGFMAALCGTVFAYEGWIVATSISKELKEPKKDLPKALVIGTVVILAIYILYYVGLAGTFLNDQFMSNGDSQVKLAFMEIFLGNQAFGTILYVFVVISCLGTLNGLTMASSRAFKTMAESKYGPKPEVFSKGNKAGMNIYAALIGFVLSLVWLGIWLHILYNGLMTGASWGIDISELVCVFLYILYIPMYISIMKNRNDLKVFNRFVMPSLAIFASLLLVVAGFISHEWGTLVFLLVTCVIIFFGMFGYKELKNNKK